MPTLHDEYPEHGVPIGCISIQPRFKLNALLRAILGYTLSYAPLPYRYAGVRMPIQRVSGNLCSESVRKAVRSYESKPQKPTKQVQEALFR